MEEVQFFFFKTIIMLFSYQQLFLLQKKLPYQNSKLNSFNWKWATSSIAYFHCFYLSKFVFLVPSWWGVVRWSLNTDHSGCRHWRIPSSLQDPLCRFWKSSCVVATTKFLSPYQTFHTIVPFPPSFLYTFFITYTVFWYVQNAVLYFKMITCRWGAFYA